MYWKVCIQRFFCRVIFCYWWLQTYDKFLYNSQTKVTDIIGISLQFTLLIDLFNWVENLNSVKSSNTYRSENRTMLQYEGPVSINTNRYYNRQTTIISIYIYLFVHLYVILFLKMFEWQTSDWIWMYTMKIWFIST